MEEHRVVSSGEWLAARQALLEQEKEFTRLRDEWSRQRRELPWEAVTKSNCSTVRPACAPSVSSSIGVAS
jgi:predicted dithiol-disulfide oxidoreductase (DUF899 family)